LGPQPRTVRHLVEAIERHATVGRDGLAGLLVTGFDPVAEVAEEWFVTLELDHRPEDRRLLPFPDASPAVDMEGPAQGLERLGVLAAERLDDGQAADHLADAPRPRRLEAEQADEVDHRLAERVIGVEAALVVGDGEPGPPGDVLAAVPDVVEQRPL